MNRFTFAMLTLAIATAPIAASAQVPAPKASGAMSHSSSMKHTTMKPTAMSHSSSMSHASPKP